MSTMQNLLTRSLAATVASFQINGVPPDEVLTALTAVAITVIGKGGTTREKREMMLTTLQAFSEDGI